ncbi:hypothetical protein GCM10028778_11300 [Barrientosiimonas marina]|uniref:M14 family metallocarboxypeptidase n=1 Tax=Lentibacillus kimchii TaxID=1542911 RepID=A0ABW2V0C4_9BACI
MKIVSRPNDTLTYYSKLFDVPLILLEQANQGFDAEVLPRGQTVQIPGYALFFESSPRHTLKTIAIERNILIDQLLVTNQLVSPDELSHYDQIIIPEPVNDFIITDCDHYTSAKLERDIQKLMAVYPFMRSQSAGSTVMGKTIPELGIGTGETHVHLNGSFHANEWITTAVIMRFLNEYLLALTNQLPIRGMNLHAYFLQTHLSVVPMVNLDGVDLVIEGVEAAGAYQTEVLTLNNQSNDFANWKANITGVDLNNQYPACWDTEAKRKPDSPQPRDYPGSHPLTEPEALAMQALTAKRDFKRVTALHTQGKEIYWGFADLEPSDAKAIAREYCRVSGYRPVQNLDSYAGFKDWFIQEFRRPGYTVELGAGVNPLSFEQFESIYQEALGIMLANLYVS